jgi:hypothetical protein
MKQIVQARLDRAAQKELAELVRSLGWSPSKVVRESIRLLAVCQTGKKPRPIIGLGKFASRVDDLGSNKKHLKGFGA